VPFTSQPSEKSLKQPKDWEEKWNRIVREEKKKLSGDTTFMDVNDSFTE